MCVGVYLFLLFEHFIQVLDFVFRVVLKAEFSSRCLLRVISGPDLT